LLDNINDLSSILSTVVLPEDRFKIYKTNILITPKQLKKTTKDLFKFLVINLKKIQAFSEGDILKHVKLYEYNFGQICKINLCILLSA